MEELIGNTIYIILSIKEGQGLSCFEEPITVSGSLNGQTLHTDPATPRSPATTFNSDLIWETDRKALRRLRIQNVPLKLRVSAGPRASGAYLALSLRAARPLPASAPVLPRTGYSWYRLLGARGAPELLLALTLRDTLCAPVCRRPLPSWSRSQMEREERMVPVPSEGDASPARWDGEEEGGQEGSVSPVQAEREGYTNSVQSEQEGTLISLQSDQEKEGANEVQEERKENVNPFQVECTEQEIRESPRQEPDKAVEEPEERKHLVQPESSPRRRTEEESQCLQELVEDLELWRERQEELCKVQLKQKEGAYLEALRLAGEEQRAAGERAVQHAARTLAQVSGTLVSQLERAEAHTERLHSEVRERLRRAAEDREQLQCAMACMTEENETLKKTVKMQEEELLFLKTCYQRALDRSQQVVTKQITNLAPSHTIDNIHIHFAYSGASMSHVFLLLYVSRLCHYKLSFVCQERLEERLRSALSSRQFFQEQGTAAARRSQLLQIQLLALHKVLAGEEALLRIDRRELRCLGGQLQSPVPTCTP